MLYGSKWPQYTESMKKGVQDILDNGKVNQWTEFMLKSLKKNMPNILV